jgi:hypothetical protein
MFFLRQLYEWRNASAAANLQPQNNGWSLVNKILEPVLHTLPQLPDSIASMIHVSNGNICE